MNEAKGAFNKFTIQHTAELLNKKPVADGARSAI